jgi:hypothetical protein
MRAFAAPFSPSATWDRRAPLVAWTVWLGLIALLAWHHEAWRDEAETWLVARDAPFGEMLHRTAYCGQPFLWFAVLFPFAKAGFPFATQQVIALVFAAAAAWLLLARAPFSVPVRVLAAFGYFASFEYSVVARCYVLAILGLFVLASRAGPATWLDGLLLALVANATAYGFLMAAVVFLVRFRELPPRARLIACLGLAFVVWQLWPPPDGYTAPFKLWRNVSLFPLFAPLAFFPDHDGLFFRLAGAGLLGVAALRLRGRPRSLALLILGWGALLAFMTFVYVSGLRHVGLLAVWLVFVLWEDRVRGAGPGPRVPVRRVFAVFAAASLLVGVATAIRTWRLEIASHFSEGPLMATYLRENGLALAPIAAHPAPHTESVLACLPERTFWYPGIREYGSFMKWDAACAQGEKLAAESAVSRVLEAFPAGRRPLLLLNRTLAGAQTSGYRLLYATPGNISAHRFPHRDEQFFLYAPLPSP